MHVLTAVSMSAAAILGRVPTVSPAEVTTLHIDLSRAGRVISPLLFGQNIEITRNGVWRGLGAEMVANRKFAALAGALPAQWEAVGSAGRVGIDTERTFVGRHAVRVDVAADGERTGIAQGQDALAIAAGRPYTIRIQAQTDASRAIDFLLTDAEGLTLAEHTFIAEPGGWRALTCSFVPLESCAHCRLEIASSTPGTFRIGSVSMQPSDAFHGMRRDVVALLKRLRPGMLRYPGGCYAEFYHWRDGLLPVDRRPPVGPTGLPFLLPDQDDYDSHEIGTDEFIALCREVGAQPAITVRLSESTADDAAAWVEYCNGGARTKWGKVRASRGHRRPYGVTTWFVGNELWAFGRGGLTDPAAAARQTRLFAEAMRRVDPGIDLVGCTLSAPGDWNDRLIPEIAGHVDLYSAHDYLLDHFKGGLEEIARAPSAALRPLLEQARDDFRAKTPQGHRTRVVFDEWNTLWGLRGSVEMGLYAGGVLNLLCRDGAALGVERACYFMPCSEGAIKVTPLGASLDPAGQVFALFAAHQGNHLLPTPSPTPSDDFDACASMASDGTAVVTLVNRSADHEACADIVLENGGPLKRATVDLLVPLTVAKGEPEFVQTRELLRVHDKHVTVVVPPAGIARVRVASGVSARRKGPE